MRRLFSTGKLDVDVARGKKNSAQLYQAAVGGHKDAVKILLDRGADPNIEDSWGETPLK